MKYEPETYVCGCIRGSFLCSDAVELWNAVAPQYQKACDTGDWTSYDQARESYKLHFIRNYPHYRRHISDVRIVGPFHNQHIVGAYLTAPVGTMYQGMNIYVYEGQFCLTANGGR